MKSGNIEDEQRRDALLLRLLKTLRIHALSGSAVGKSLLTKKSQAE
jgi:hypothetical protein